MNRTYELHKKIKILRDEMLEHAKTIKDPKESALVEASGEILGGIDEAFDKFSQKHELAWQ